MDRSKFLSKVMGLYFLIVSTAMMLNMSQFIQQIDKLINDAPLMFVTGFFTLIIGLLLVVSHNIWQWHWRVIITLLAWLTLLKGINLIMFPALLEDVSLYFIQNTTFAYSAAGFDFILGLVLSYFGFKRELNTF